MNKIFNAIARFSATISVQSGRLISWLTVAMVIVLSINVLSGWLFNLSSILATESITWMHSANFLLAAAYTFNRDEQVRVDIFYAKMTARGKAIVNLLGTLVLLLPTMAFILWSSWSYVVLSYNINEVSAEAGGMPATFILKGMLLVMPVLLTFEAINQIIRNTLIIIGSEVEGGDDQNTGHKEMV